MNGTLYGTTTAFGKGGDGTLYSIKVGLRDLYVLHSFGKNRGTVDGADPVAGLTYMNGRLYGTTQYGGANNDGTVFVLTL